MKKGFIASVLLITVFAVVSYAAGGTCESPTLIVLEQKTEFEAGEIGVMISTMPGEYKIDTNQGHKVSIFRDPCDCLDVTSDEIVRGDEIYRGADGSFILEQGGTLFIEFITKTKFMIQLKEE